MSMRNIQWAIDWFFGHASRCGQRGASRLVIASVLLVPGVLGFGATANAADTSWDDVRELEPVYVERLQSWVDLLGNESLEETIARLDEVSRYFEPGGGPLPPVSGRHGASIAPGADAVDIHAILSNRRFLKSYKDLGTVPRSQAVQLVASALDEALPRYLRAYEGKLASFRANLEELHRRAPDTPRSAGLRVQTTSDPSGEPTMAGLRYQILSLTLCAAAYDLEELLPQVTAVVNAALDQRDYLTQDDVLEDIDKQVTLHRSSLYNRRVLLTALARLVGKDFESTVAALALPLAEFPVEHYDMPVTRYDARLVPLPPTPPVGDMELVVIGAMDDTAFDEALSQLR